MYSVQLVVSDGTLTRIPLSITYFAKEDITLYRNLDTTPLVLGTDWQWDGDTVVNLLTNTPVPDGEYITVRRNTQVDRAFNIYDGGAAFSRDTLDENFKQMIYLAQEFTEGNGLQGVFTPLDMHGFRIINLGPGIDGTDAVNKNQLDTVDARVDDTNARIDVLEESFVGQTVSYPWYTVTTETTDTFKPPVKFNKAVLEINGIGQVPNYSFIIVDSTIMLADAVPAGTMVFAYLGEPPGLDNTYVGTEQFMLVQQNVDARLDTLESSSTAMGEALEALDERCDSTDDSIEDLNDKYTMLSLALANKASSGNNSSITKLSGLTGGIVGVTSGQPATLGIIGEVIGDTATSADTPIELNTVKGIHSIVLTPGEWFVEGMLRLSINGTEDLTLCAYGLTTTEGSLSSYWWDTVVQRLVAPTGSASLNTTHTVPSKLIRVTGAPLTVYLAAVLLESTGTLTGNGYMIARRVR